MKKWFYPLLYVLGVCSCTSTQVMPDNREYTYNIHFPEPPVEIMSNIDKEATQYDSILINYFNIIKVKEDLYYMYYAAVGRLSERADDLGQGLFFAHSSNGFKWDRHFPQKSGPNYIFGSEIKEQSVFMVPWDDQFPFRLIANIEENGKELMCIWKSDNGIVFNNRVTVMDDFLHDTQNVVVPTKDNMKLYTRLWDGWNRKIATGLLGKDGKLLTSLDKLKIDHVYNSAASKLDSQFDILFPTYMNNKMSDPQTDKAYLKSFLIKDGICQEIECGINKWIKPEEKWMLVSPGIIDIKGDTYIAYNTRTWSHDTKKPDEGISRYYIIRVKIDKVYLDIDY